MILNNHDAKSSWFQIIMIQNHRISKGGSEILESLGYTEYTGFALQFPRNIIPDMFAGNDDHYDDDQ